MLRLERDIVDRLRLIDMVLVDIDGTLVSPDHPTFRNVVGWLRKLKPLGIEFGIATGRTIHGASAYSREFLSVGMRPAPTITYNGAVVLAGREPALLVRHVLEPSAAAAVLARCRTLGLTALSYACFLKPDLSPREEVFCESPGGPDREFNGMPVTRVSDVLAFGDDLVAILVAPPNPELGRDLATKLAEEFAGTLRITTSGGRYIEISPPRGTKLEAMREVSRLRRGTVAEVMAIGDNFNDLEMIREAGVGVAVANAPDPVRAVAAMRCSQSGGYGVVEALRVLVRAHRSRAP